MGFRCKILNHWGAILISAAVFEVLIVFNRDENWTLITPGASFGRAVIRTMTPSDLSSAKSFSRAHLSRQYLDSECFKAREKFQSSISSDFCEPA